MTLSIAIRWPLAVCRGSTKVFDLIKELKLIAESERCEAKGLTPKQRVRQGDGSHPPTEAEIATIVKHLNASVSGKLSSSELAFKATWSRAWAFKILRRLEEQGMVARSGTQRSTKWFLTKKEKANGN